MFGDARAAVGDRRTVIDMERTPPPPKVRTLVRTAAVLLCANVTVVVVAMLAFTSATLEAVEQIDPATFAVPTIQRTPESLFLSGWGLSLGAGLGQVGLLAALRLRRPWKRTAYQVMVGCAAGGTLVSALALATLVADGPSPARIGAVATVIWSAPLLRWVRDPVIRAWSQHYEPPPPPLPT